jgi:hypothetical protein
MEKNIGKEIPEELPYKKFIGELTEWEPNDFFKRMITEYGAFTGIITGSSRAGKSNFLKYLLTGEPHIEKYFDFILVFSRTLVNGFYQSFLDSKLMFAEYNENVIYDMEQLYAKKKLENKKFRWLVILDDIVDSKSKYIKSIEKIFFSGRHVGCSLIFLTQKMSLMNTGWVANCLFVVALFAGSRNEKLYVSEKVIADNLDEKYALKSIKQTEHIAYLAHSSICRDYQALIILPYEKEPRIFKFKAPLMAKSKKKKVQSIFEKFLPNDGEKNKNNN